MIKIGNFWRHNKTGQTVEVIWVDRKLVTIDRLGMSQSESNEIEKVPTKRFLKNYSRKCDEIIHPQSLGLDVEKRSANVSRDTSTDEFTISLYFGEHLFMERLVHTLFANEAYSTARDWVEGRLV